MAKSKHPLGLNPFGEALWKLMQERGMTSWAQLAELVSEHGYECSEEEMRQWVHHEPPDVMRDTTN